MNRWLQFYQGLKKETKMNIEKRVREQAYRRYKKTDNNSNKKMNNEDQMLAVLMLQIFDEESMII